jgi:hypothetical protein
MSDLKELAIEICAQDSDMVGFWEIEINSGTSAMPQKRAEIIEDYSYAEVVQLKQDLRRTYDLSETDFNRAIGKCLARIAGISCGREFFK